MTVLALFCVLDVQSRQANFKACYCATKDSFPPSGRGFVKVLGTELFWAGITEGFGVLDCQSVFHSRLPGGGSLRSWALGSFGRE